MQPELQRLGEMATITILAQGDVFTLAKASVYRLKNVRGSAVLLSRVAQIAGQEWEEVTAEGMARRSHLDTQDINRGQEIAAGRALKALRRKLKGNGKAVIRHRFMG